MNYSQTLLILIPARSGSKGLPGKNTRPLHGKPLIAWTIEAARHDNGCLSRVVTSTDDAAIAAIAQAWGAEIPFLRPKELAQDRTPAIDVVLHALEWFETSEQYRPDLLMYLQPTSPLRTAQDIRVAIQLLLDKGADSVVSVSPVKNHPYWMKQLDAEGRMTDFLTEFHAPANRQELPTVYALNGAIYLARRDVLLQSKTWYTDRTYAYVMLPERSLDIDSLWDWRLVEATLSWQESRSSDSSGHEF